MECSNCSDKLDFPGSDEFFTDVEYVLLETNDDCLINEIEQLAVIDTLIFIVTNQGKQLLKFSKNNGQFLSATGNVGNGPNEYVSVNSLFIDAEEKTVTALDIWGSKLIKYDFSGHFISSEQFVPNTNVTNKAIYTKNGDIIFHNLLAPNLTAAYSVLKKDASKVEELLSYGSLKVDNYAIAFSKHPVVYCDEHTDFIMPFDNHIYRYKDGNMSCLYQVKFSGKPTDRRMASERDKSLFVSRQLMAMNNCFPGFTAIFETSGKLLLNSYNNTPKPCFFYGDIQNKKGNYYNYAVEPVGINPVFEITAVSENMFIAALDGSLLYGWKENYKDPQEIGNTSLRKIIEGITEGSNPCLIIYYVK
jgi:hypothetical protein